MRELGSWGSILAGPRRRRGGGRRALTGRVAREGEGQHDAKERWRSFGVTRGQLCKQEVARGWPSTAGGARHWRRPALNETEQAGLGRVKASRPLIRVLVINDNGLWINDFI